MTWWQTNVSNRLTNLTYHQNMSAQEQRPTWEVVKINFTFLIFGLSFLCLFRVDDHINVTCLCCVIAWFLLIINTYLGFVLFGILIENVYQRYLLGWFLVLRIENCLFWCCINYERRIISWSWCGCGCWRCNVAFCHFIIWNAVSYNVQSFAASTFFTEL